MFICFLQRAALAEAQAGLDVVMAQLKDAKARLAGVQKRLAELQKGFDDAVAKKQVSQGATQFVFRFYLLTNVCEVETCTTRQDSCHCTAGPKQDIAPHTSISDTVSNMYTTCRSMMIMPNCMFAP